MRLRKPVLITFILLLFLFSYLALGKFSVELPNDKFLHFVAFFVVTICFYWIVDTNSIRKVRNITFVVVTLLGSIVSEFIQGLVPYRTFDPRDILANIIGSLLGLILSAWYHKRMLDRRRKSKYSSLHSISNTSGIEMDTSLQDENAFDFDLEADNHIHGENIEEEEEDAEDHDLQTENDNIALKTMHLSGIDQ